MIPVDSKTPVKSDSSSESLYETITDDLVRQGYSINPEALPPSLAKALYQQVLELNQAEFDTAGIGRQQAHTVDTRVRTDEICWINGSTNTGQNWLNWAGGLREYINSQLFLGLFSFESHFAHYGPGDFYKRHLDAFKGESNRLLSLVVYLNPEWEEEDKGELVLYRDEHDMTGIKVSPTFGTVVAFLSEDFPHEVLPAKRDRYSIAGWYRLNNSIGNRIDPPR